MKDNPYQPPNSPVRTAPEHNPQPVRGVVAGLTVYVAGSFTLVNFLLLLAMRANTDGAPADVGLALVLTSALDPASAIGAVATLLVLAMSFAAGYVCAAVAKMYSLIAPTVVATVSVSLELFFGPGAQPTGVWIGLSALTFLLTLGGGYAWIRLESADVVLE